VADVAEDGEQEGPGGDASGGALVVELLRDSPADQAGMEPGDVVVEVDGRPVENAAQLRNELARAQVGTQLRMTVRREGRRRTLRIAVVEGGTGA
jgi:serine protease Do/serine protease DegQ